MNFSVFEQEFAGQCGSDPSKKCLNTCQFLKGDLSSDLTEAEFRALNGGSKSGGFIVDGGSAVHMLGVPHRSILRERVGEGQTLTAHGTGTLPTFATPLFGVAQFNSKLDFSILSQHRLSVERGIGFWFPPGGGDGQGIRDGRVCCELEQSGRVFWLQITDWELFWGQSVLDGHNSYFSHHCHFGAQASAQLNHERLCHFLPKAKSCTCEVCELTKTYKPGHSSKRLFTAKYPFKKVYADTLFLNEESLHGNKYSIDGIDEHCDVGYCHPCPTHSARDVVEFLDGFSLQFKTPEQLVSDSGSEFLNAPVKSWCTKNKASFRHSSVAESEEIGKAERFHQTLLTAMRATIQGHNPKLWDLCIRHVCYVHNLVPKKKFGGKSPLEMSGQVDSTAPWLARLRKWGCRVRFYSSTISTSTSKVGLKCDWGMYVGCSWSVPGGHIILRKNGSLLHTTQCRFDEHISVYDHEDELLLLPHEREQRAREASSASPAAQLGDVSGVGVTVAATVTPSLETGADPRSADGLSDEIRHPDADFEQFRNFGALAKQFLTRFKVAFRHKNDKSTKQQAQLAAQDAWQNSRTRWNITKFNFKAVDLEKVLREQLGRYPEDADTTAGEESSSDDSGAGSSAGPDLEDFLRETLVMAMHERGPDIDSKEFEDFLESSATRTEMCLLQTLSVGKALKGEDADKWREAINKEISSLKEKRTWRDPTESEREDLRKRGVRTLPTALILQKKADGTYKARLVVLGNLQVTTDGSSGEFYAATTQPITVRATLAQAVSEGEDIAQADISTAFLNSELLPSERLLVRMPKELGGGEKLLLRGLYGLRNAPKLWNRCFHQHLLTLGFRPSVKDRCLYVKRVGRRYLRLVLYVDDFIITGKDAQKWAERILSKFSGKLLASLPGDKSGTLRFLGSHYHVDREKHELSLSQPEMLEQLRKFLPDGEIVGKVESPFLYSEPSKLAPCGHYRAVVGSLMWMLHSRPEIAEALKARSQCLEKPTDFDWAKALQVVRYLWSTRTTKLVYRLKGVFSSLDSLRKSIRCYSDSNWTHESQGRSTSGMVVTLNGTPLLWGAKLQPVVSRSSCEAELIALNSGAVELVFMSYLLGEMLNDGQTVRGFTLVKRNYPQEKVEGDPSAGEHFELKPPVGDLLLEGDNQAAIRIATGGNCKRIKHIAIRFLALHNEVDRGFYSIGYVNTEENLADGFTKELPKLKFGDWVDKLYGR